MYGTIFRMKVKPGREADVIALSNEWAATRLPVAKGAVADYLLKPDADSGELVGVAVFEDKASYEANADDPEQDKWYRSLMENLEADPDWEDGEFVVGATS